jgi:uncharacterized protein HemX
MEERKVPPPQRGNIDGIRPRQLDDSTPPASKPQAQNAQPTVDQKTPQNRQVGETSIPKPKKTRHLAVIIPAVIIFIGLAALAVYTGLSQNSSGGQSSQEAASGDTSASDSKQLIDQTINEIDQISDQPDTSGDGLSIDQLGL